MSIKISNLWLMWLGGTMYDLVCSYAHFFPGHTPHERFYKDIATALFICTACIVARCSLVPRPTRGAL